MDDIYENIEEYNPNKKSQIMIVFDVIFADMFSNRNFNPTVNELFIRGRKLDISLVFIPLCYFSIPKEKFVANKNFNKSHLIIIYLL